ncbi:unnamed protein product [Prorocentrum cordatum]|uniref:Uncharacterized protein n=1 Tax=Prorocentrum cordatum TaxID=2364126 RepID=A0ABN9QN16_9DINO|nr:unnamed protein product [Polarella glacialis]
MPRATGPRPAELHPGAPGRARRGRADHHNMKTTAVGAAPRAIAPARGSAERTGRRSGKGRDRRGEGEEAKGGAGEGAATIRAVESCTAGRTELFLLGPSS